MNVIIEIEASQIEKKTLYAFCRKKGFIYFKNIDETCYYVKTTSELNQILIIDYLTNKEVNYVLYIPFHEQV